MGTRGSVEMRRKEAAAAARILGVAHRENLGLPDAHLEMRMDYKLAVARRIRALRPRTLFFPTGKDGIQTITRLRSWATRAAFWLV